MGSVHQRRLKPTTCTQQPLTNLDMHYVTLEAPMDTYTFKVEFDLEADVGDTNIGRGFRPLFWTNKLYNDMVGFA